MTLLRVDDAASFADPLFDTIPIEERVVLSEENFKRTIAVERKRTERSREPFLLMLVEAGRPRDTEKSGKALDKIVSAMLSSTRETDVVGWYKGRTTVGVMFTGLAIQDRSTVLSTILARVSAALRDELPSDEFSQISLSFHFFPDDWDHENSARPSNPVLYPDLLSANDGKRSLLVIKRAMDIFGSAVMLILCAPLLAIIAAAVKVSSRGLCFSDSIELDSMAAGSLSSSSARCEPITIRAFIRNM